jgi:hypothetical protein
VTLDLPETLYCMPYGSPGKNAEFVKKNLQIYESFLDTGFVSMQQCFFSPSKVKTKSNYRFFNFIEVLFSYN